jgi:WD40 repeat protein
MAHTDCPSEAELTAFTVGNLPAGAVDAVAAHLETCSRCDQLLHRLDQVADEVVSSLRNLSGVSARLAGPFQAVAAPRQVGDYEILDELGRGGMGVVFKARHTQLQRVVALKMLLAGAFVQEDFRARFRAEAAAVARLQHPNIVQVFDIGEWRGSTAGPPAPYFTLEYVDGGSLSTRLAGKPQPPRQAATWLRTLAWAVHYAHGQGIVHRDLKPSNVLVTAGGELKLCDFGVAKRLTGSDLQTLSGLLVGTPEYMAPEQALGGGQQAGPAADVYALGAMLYTMLTGRPPFQGASMLDTLDQVRAQEPVPPRRLQPAVPRDLETICLKCLHKDPRRRYASAAALAEDVDCFLNGRTILARPTGVVERGWKWARRRPAEAILSAAVVLIAVVGFGAVSWQWHRAEAKASAEEAANQEAQAARREAVAKQAELALNQGLALCEKGEVGRGLLWLARSLNLATEARAERLDRAIRVNLADWQSQLSHARVAMRHSAPVLDLAFDPGGRTLVSVGKDWNVRFWDTRTGNEIVPPFIHRRSLVGTRWIGRAAFSPRDGNLLATADDAGRAYFWDIERRQPRGPSLIHPAEHMIWGVAFSPDGQRLVTCCDDGAVRRWDVASRQLIGEPIWHNRKVGYYTLALSPDGRRLVTGGKDQRVVRWDLEAGRRLDSLNLASPVQGIAFSGDGRKVIIGTREGTLHVWDPGAARVFDLPPQGTAVTGLAVSPDGRTFASGTEAGVVRIWDQVTLAQVGQTYKLVSPVRSLVFDPDGKMLAVGQEDGTIKLWEVPQAKAIGLPLLMGSSVHSLAFRRDGRRLLAGSNKGAQWWDLDTSKALDSSMDEERYEPAGTVTSLDGRRTYDKINLIHAMALSPDGRTLAFACCTGVEGVLRGRAELWDATTGERLRQTPEQPTPFRGAVYSPDGQWLLTWNSRPRSALLWDTATLQQSRPLLRSLPDSIHQAAFTADGKTLLLGCRDGTARLWDVDRDEEINPQHAPHHAYPISAVAFEPGFQRHGKVVTGCYGGTVRLWDVERGTLLNDVRGNAGEITALAFSPDGKTLVTASHDGTARFWDAECGRQLGPVLRHTDAVLSVAFHPDGQSVATGTKDGVVQRWRVPLPPREGSVAEIQQWANDQAGMKLDDQGAVHMVSTELLERRGL